MKHAERLRTWFCGGFWTLPSYRSYIAAIVYFLAFWNFADSHLGCMVYLWRTVFQCKPAKKCRQRRPLQVRVARTPLPGRLQMVETYDADSESHAQRKGIRPSRVHRESESELQTNISAVEKMSCSQAKQGTKDMRKRPKAIRGGEATPGQNPCHPLKALLRSDQVRWQWAAWRWSTDFLEFEIWRVSYSRQFSPMFGIPNSKVKQVVCVRNEANIGKYHQIKYANLNSQGF